MSAARIEVFSEKVKLINNKRVIGNGRGTYELRDFDAYMDVWHTKPVDPPGSIGHVEMQLGKGVGSASVLTEQHNTIVGIDIAQASASLEGAPGASTSYVIQDSYGAAPVPITDSKGNVLVIITHILNP